jgi:hypothetical protein
MQEMAEETDVARVFSAAFWLCTLALMVSFSVRNVQADWMPSTGAETAPNFAEINVLGNRVRVALEIDLADYPAFVPGDDSADPIPLDAEPDPAALPRSTGGTLTILGADGSSIEPQIRKIEFRDRKPRPTAQSAARGSGSPSPSAGPQRSERVIYAELDYPFSGRPETLTFVPPLDDKGATSVSIGFLAHHGRVPITDYRYLSVPETLNLDWNDPWYSAFENPNLARHHRSALMSFLSIEPREVRHEIIFRLRDLEGWTDLGLGNARKLDVSQIEDVKRAAEQFFAAHNPVVIDGASTDPTAMQVEVLDIGVTGLQILKDPEDLDRATALLGIVLAYPQRTLPSQLTMTWQLFRDGVETIPVRVTDPAGGVPGRVTADAPEVTWTNFLKAWKNPAISPVTVNVGREIGIPVLSALLLGLGGLLALKAARSTARRRWTSLALLAGLAAIFTVRVAVLPVPLPGGAPDSQAAIDISDAMLRNAATAMLETQPEGFEAALGSFVSAGEIGSVGAEMRRGLSVTLPSGALARTDAIQAVTVEEIEPRGDGLSLLATWTARVSGGHWGHLHRREIQYRALMDVTEVDGVWKLNGLTVLSARPSA